MRYLDAGRIRARSLIRGVGRALDIRGSISRDLATRRAPGARRSDRAAIASDWLAVWSDLGHAFSVVRKRDEAAGP
jgi:hypothetical protein